MKLNRHNTVWKSHRLPKCLLAVFLGASVFLSGCGPAEGSQGAFDASSEENGKLKVAVTLFPYYDFVRQIAGDQVDLQMVIPAGMDSHSFEPTPADIRTIQHADVLISNGGTMEHWLEDTLGALDTSNMTIVTMMDYVDTVEEEIVEGMEDAGHDHDHDHVHSHTDSDDHDHSHETPEEHAAHAQEVDDHDHSGETPEEHAAHAQETDDHDHSDYVDHDGHEETIEYDEHIWTSPVNAMKLVDVIGETLAEADPAHAEVFRLGAENYKKELEEIDAGFREVSRNRKRNMIVMGDKFPFRYLADEYQLDYRAAFSGCSSDTEPSAKTIAYLIDKVKEEQIPVVYYLELSSHRVSEIIGEETGAEPLLLHSCHNVTRAQFDSGITYAELMRQNIENLRKGID
ncbi:zinc ABC transporter substrate-binding protein [Clostridium sp. OM02-18AC]|uniref:metal ABC transporter substrate-binding protein n=1 Tax=Clostridium sp. OM02-18AC TaxID=2292311 RepID=UPI000E4B6B09|nr:metal ABC transporter substrate-binding protein [Clostridium sp. OM02-18AC]RHV64587.1 zinc ABC transporter substrate-binding protein [Clostridium sp. OM02-18AC]